MWEAFIALSVLVIVAIDAWEKRRLVNSMRRAARVHDLPCQNCENIEVCPHSLEGECWHKHGGNNAAVKSKPVKGVL